MQPTKDEMSRVSCASFASVNGEGGQDILHRKRPELTITVEKIDRFREEMQQQIRAPWLDEINLTVVSAQLASREPHRRGI